MMKPVLNRRGCLALTLFLLLAIGLLLWLGLEAPPSSQPDPLPPAQPQ